MNHPLVLCCALNTHIDSLSPEANLERSMRVLPSVFHRLFATGIFLHRRLPSRTQSRYRLRSTALLTLHPLSRRRCHQSRQSRTKAAAKSRQSRRERTAKAQPREEAIR